MARFVLACLVMVTGSVDFAQACFRTRIARRPHCVPCPAVPVCSPLAVVPSTLPAPVAREPFDDLPADVQLHLLAIERRSQSWKAYYTECERTMTNNFTKRTTNWTGSLRALKPSYAYFRIDNVGQKDDFVAFIFSDRSAYEYSGIDKTVRVYSKDRRPSDKLEEYFYNLINPFSLFENQPLTQFLSGALTARALAERFEVSLLKEDEHYIYLRLHPRAGSSSDEIITLVVFSDKVKGLEYLAAMVRCQVNSNQIVDEWRFKQPVADPQGIRALDFQYVKPPKDWKKRLITQDK